MVEIGQDSATSFTEGLAREHLHRHAFGLLGTGRSDETGEDDDVGDVTLAGSPNFQGQQVAGRRREHREAGALQHRRGLDVLPGRQEGGRLVVEPPEGKTELLGDYAGLGQARDVA